MATVSFNASAAQGAVRSSRTRVWVVGHIVEWYGCGSISDLKRVVDVSLQHRAAVALANATNAYVLGATAASEQAVGMRAQYLDVAHGGGMAGDDDSGAGRVWVADPAAPALRYAVGGAAPMRLPAPPAAGGTFAGAAAAEDGSVLVGYVAGATGHEAYVAVHVHVATVGPSTPPSYPTEETAATWHTHRVACRAGAVRLRGGHMVRTAGGGGRAVRVPARPAIYCSSRHGDGDGSSGNMGNASARGAADDVAVLLLDSHGAAVPAATTAHADYGHASPALAGAGRGVVARHGAAAAVAAGTLARATVVRIASDAGGVWVAMVGGGVGALRGVSVGPASHQLLIARLSGPTYTVAAAVSVDTLRSLAVPRAWGGTGGGGVGVAALVGVPGSGGGTDGVYVFGNVGWGGIDFGGGAALQRSGYGTCGFAARYSAAAAHVASRYICGRGDTEVTAAVRGSPGGAVVAITTRAAELGGPHEGVGGETKAWYRRAGGGGGGVRVLVASMGVGVAAPVGVSRVREWAVRRGTGAGNEGGDAAYDARIHALAEDCGHAAYSATPAVQATADRGYVAIVEVGGSAGAATMLEIDTLTRITAGGGAATWAVVALDAQHHATRAAQVGGGALVWWGRAGAEGGPPAALAAGAGWIRPVGVVSDGRGGWWVCGSGSGTVAHHGVTSGAGDGTEYELYVHYGADLVTDAGVVVGGTSGGGHLRVRACAPDGVGGVIAVSDYNKAHTRGADALVLPTGTVHHAATRVSAGGVVSYVGLGRVAAGADHGWGRVHDVAMVSFGGVCTAVAGGYMAAGGMALLPEAAAGPLDHHGQVAGTAIIGAACSGVVSEGHCGAAGATTARALAVGVGSGASRVVAVGMDDGSSGGYYVAVQGSGMTAYAGVTAGITVSASQFIIARHKADHGVLWVKQVTLSGGAALPRVRLLGDGSGGVWIGGTINAETINCEQSGVVVTTVVGAADVFVLRLDAGARVHVCAQHGSPQADAFVDMTRTRGGGVLVAATALGTALTFGGAAVTASAPPVGVARGVLVEYSKNGARRALRVYAAATAATAVGGVATVGDRGAAGATACGLETYYVSMTVGAEAVSVGGHTIAAASEGLYLVRVQRGADGEALTTDAASDVYRVAYGAGAGALGGYTLAAGVDGTVWACGTVGGGGAVTVAGAGAQAADGALDEMYVRVRVHAEDGTTGGATGGYEVRAARRVALATTTSVTWAGLRGCVADGAGGVWAASTYEHPHVRGGVSVAVPAEMDANHLVMHISGSGAVDDVDVTGATAVASAAPTIASWLDLSLNGQCELVLGGSGSEVGSAYSAATSVAVPVTAGERGLLIRRRVGWCGGDGVAVARTIGCAVVRAAATRQVVRDGDVVPSGALTVAAGVDGGLWAVVRGGIGADVYGGVRLAGSYGTSTSATIVARHAADGRVVSVGVAACYAASGAHAGPDGGVWVGGTVTAAGGCVCGDVSDGSGAAAGAGTVAVGDTIVCFYDRDGRARGQVEVGSARRLGASVAAAVELRAIAGHMAGLGTMVVVVQATAVVDALRVGGNGGGGVVDVGVAAADTATQRLAAVAVVVQLRADGRAAVLDAAGIRGDVSAPLMEVVAVAAVGEDDDAGAAAVPRWALVGTMAHGAKVAADGTRGAPEVAYTYTGAGTYRVVALYVDARGGALSAAPLATTGALAAAPTVQAVGDDAGGVWVAVGLAAAGSGSITPVGGAAAAAQDGGGVLFRVSAAGAVAGPVMGAEDGGAHQLRVLALQADGHGGVYAVLRVAAAAAAAAPYAAHVRVGTADAVAVGASGAGGSEARAVVRVGRDGAVRALGAVGAHAPVGRTTLRAAVAVLDGCRVAVVAVTANAAGGGSAVGDAVGGGAANVRYASAVARSDTSVVVYEAVAQCSAAATTQAAQALATVAVAPVLDHVFVYAIVRGADRSLWMLATASGVAVVGGASVTVHAQQHVLVRAPMDLSASGPGSWSARAYARQHTMTLASHASGHVWVVGTCSGSIAASASVVRTATGKDACVLHYGRDGAGSLLGAGVYGGAGDQGATTVLPTGPSSALVAVQVTPSLVRVVMATSPMSDQAAAVMSFAVGVGVSVELEGLAGAQVRVAAAAEACGGRGGSDGEVAYVIVGSTTGSFRVVGNAPMLGAHTFVLQLTRSLAVVDHVRVADGGGLNATALTRDGAGGWWVCGNTDPSHTGHIRVGDGLQTSGGAAVAVAVRLEEAVGGRGRRLNVTALWRSGVPAAAGAAVHVTCDGDGRGGVWVGGTQATRDAESAAFAIRLYGMAEAAVVAHVDASGREAYARALTRPDMGSGGRVVIGAVAALDQCQVVVGGHVVPQGATRVGDGVTVSAPSGLLTRLRDAQCAAYGLATATGTAGGCGIVPVAAVRFVDATVVALARGPGGGYFLVATGSHVARIGAVALANGAAQAHQLIILRYTAAHAGAHGRAIDLGEPLGGGSPFGAVAHDGRGGVWMVLSRAATAPPIDFGAGPAARRGGVDGYAVHYDDVLTHLTTTCLGDGNDVTPVDAVVTKSGQVVVLANVVLTRAPGFMPSTIAPSIMETFAAPSMVYVFLVSARGTVQSDSGYILHTPDDDPNTYLIPHRLVYSCARDTVYTVLSGHTDSPAMPSFKGTDYLDAFYLAPTVLGIMQSSRFVQRLAWEDPSPHSTGAYAGAFVDHSMQPGDTTGIVCTRLTGDFTVSASVKETAGREQILMYTSDGELVQNHTDSDSASVGAGIRCAADGLGGVWVAFDYQRATTRGSLAASMPHQHASWTAVMHASRVGDAVMPTSLYEIAPVGSGGRVTPIGALALPTCDVVIATAIDGADAGVDYGLPGDAGAAVRGSGSSVVALHQADCDTDAAAAAAGGNCADPYVPTRFVHAASDSTVSVLGVRRGVRDQMWLVLRTHDLTSWGIVPGGGIYYFDPSCFGPSQILITSWRTIGRSYTSCAAGWAGGASDNFASFDMVVTAFGDLWVAGTFLSASESILKRGAADDADMSTTLTRTGASDVYILYASTRMTAGGGLVPNVLSHAGLLGTTGADEFAGLTLRGSAQAVVVMNTDAATANIGGKSVTLSGAARSAVVVAVDTSGTVTDVRALTSGGAGRVTAHGVATVCSPSGDEYVAVVHHTAAFAVGGDVGTVAGVGVSAVALRYDLEALRSSLVATVGGAATLDGNARVGAAGDAVWVYLNVLGGGTVTVGGTAYTHANGHGLLLALAPAVGGPMVVRSSHHVRAPAAGGAHRGMDLTIDSHGSAWVAIRHRGGLAADGGAAVGGSTVALAAVLHARATGAPALGSVATAATTDLGVSSIVTSHECEVGVAVSVPALTTATVGVRTTTTLLYGEGMVAYMRVDDCEPGWLPPSCVHGASAVAPPVHIARGDVTAAAADVHGGFYLAVQSSDAVPVVGVRGARVVGGLTSGYVVRYTADATVMHITSITVNSGAVEVLGLAARHDGGVWALAQWTLADPALPPTVHLGDNPPTTLARAPMCLVVRLDPHGGVAASVPITRDGNWGDRFFAPPMVPTPDGGLFVVFTIVTMDAMFDGLPRALHVGDTLAHVAPDVVTSVGVRLTPTGAFAVLRALPLLGGVVSGDAIIASAWYDCVAGTIDVFAMWPFGGILVAEWGAPYGVTHVDPDSGVLVRLLPETLAVVNAKKMQTAPPGEGYSDGTVFGRLHVTPRAAGGSLLSGVLFISKPDVNSPMYYVQQSVYVELDSDWAVVRKLERFVTVHTGPSGRITPTSTIPTTAGVWVGTDADTTSLVSGDAVQSERYLHAEHIYALETDPHGRMRHAAHMTPVIKRDDTSMYSRIVTVVLAGSCTALSFLRTSARFASGGGQATYLDGLGYNAYMLASHRDGDGCGRGFVNTCGALPDDLAGCDVSLPFVAHAGGVAASAAAGGDWVWSEHVARGQQYTALRGSCSSAAALRRGDTGAGGAGGVGRVDLPAHTDAVDYVGDAVPTATRGFCASAAADAAVAVVGMRGAAAAYQRSSAGKYIWQQTLADSPAGAEDEYGSAIAYRDGTASGGSGWVGTIAVGAPADTSDTVWPVEDRRRSTADGRKEVGAVYVYEHAYPGTARAFVEVAYLKPPVRVASGARFGASVSVSSDGRVLVVGLPGDTRDVVGGVGGAVTVAAAAASDATAGAAAGGTAVVFARGWLGGVGGAAGDGLWWPALLLRPQAPVVGGGYGASVAVDGAGPDYEVVVGAPGEGAVYMHNVGPPGGVAADVYGAVWESVGAVGGRVVPPAVAASGAAAFGVAMRFGASVSVGAAAGGVRVAAVGAPRDWRCGSAFVKADESGSGAPTVRCEGRGSVYLYERVGAAATYTLADIFRGAGGVVGGVAAGAAVGASVSVRSSAGAVIRVAAGAPGDDNAAPPGGVVDGVVVGGVSSYVAGGNASGAVYVLERSSSAVWTVRTYTKPPMEVRDADAQYGAAGTAIVDVPSVGAVAAHVRALGCAPKGENLVGGEDPRAYMHGRGAVGNLIGVQV